MRALLLQRPKLGESMQEMQDAAAVDLALRRAAVADGATDAAFQRLWAQLLVDGWIVGPPDGDAGPELDEWLAARRSEWRANVPWDRLPWHGAQKAEQTGGLATLLGLCWAEDADGALEAHFFAAGDCGLLLLDGKGSLARAWPLESADAFSHTPMLLSSLHPPPDDAWERALFAETTLKVAPGERLLLGSDAVIQWLLRLAALGGDALAEAVARLEAAAGDFGRATTGDRHPDADAVARADALFEHARSAGLLRNDDLTLLLLLPAA